MSAYNTDDTPARYNVMTGGMALRGNTGDDLIQQLLFRLYLTPNLSRVTLSVTSADIVAVSAGIYNRSLGVGTITYMQGNTTCSYTIVLDTMADN